MNKALLKLILSAVAVADLPLTEPLGIPVVGVRAFAEEGVVFVGFKLLAADAGNLEVVVVDMMRAQKQNDRIGPVG